MYHLQNKEPSILNLHLKKALFCSMEIHKSERDMILSLIFQTTKVVYRSVSWFTSFQRILPLFPFRTAVFGVDTHVFTANVKIKCIWQTIISPNASFYCFGFIALPYTNIISLIELATSYIYIQTYHFIGFVYIAICAVCAFEKSSSVLCFIFCEESFACVALRLVLADIVLLFIFVWINKLMETAILTNRWFLLAVYDIKNRINHLCGDLKY